MAARNLIIALTYAELLENKGANREITGITYEDGTGTKFNVTYATGETEFVNCSCINFEASNPNNYWPQHG